jgi:hypothetical protein
MKPTEAKARNLMGDLQAKLNGMKPTYQKAKDMVNLEDEVWLRARLDDFKELCLEIERVRPIDDPAATHFRVARWQAIADRFLGPIKTIETYETLSRELAFRQTMADRGQFATAAGAMNQLLE